MDREREREGEKKRNIERERETWEGNINDVFWSLWQWALFSTCAGTFKIWLWKTRPSPPSKVILTDPVSTACWFSRALAQALSNFCMKEASRLVQIPGNSSHRNTTLPRAALRPARVRVGRPCYCLCFCISASLNFWATCCRSSWSDRRWMRSAPYLSLRALFSSCAHLLRALFHFCAVGPLLSRSCLVELLLILFGNFAGCWRVQQWLFSPLCLHQPEPTRTVLASLTCIPSSIMPGGDRTCG